MANKIRLILFEEWGVMVLTGKSISKTWKSKIVSLMVGLLIITLSSPIISTATVINSKDSDVTRKLTGNSSFSTKETDNINNQNLTTLGNDSESTADNVSVYNSLTDNLTQDTEETSQNNDNNQTGKWNIFMGGFLGMIAQLKAFVSGSKTNTEAPKQVVQDRAVTATKTAPTTKTPTVAKTATTAKTPTVAKTATTTKTPTVAKTATTTKTATTAKTPTVAKTATTAKTVQTAPKYVGNSGKLITLSTTAQKEISLAGKSLLKDIDGDGDADLILDVTGVDFETILKNEKIIEKASAGKIDVSFGYDASSVRVRTEQMEKRKLGYSTVSGTRALEIVLNKDIEGDVALTTLTHECLHAIGVRLDGHVNNGDSIMDYSYSDTQTTDFDNAMIQNMYKGFKVGTNNL
jgi:hypothetical protein